MIRTSHVIVDPARPDSAALDEAARVLSRGGLVAFATETVYGLGAVATDADAVARIFAAKGRPAINPLIVHVESIERAKECVADWPPEADSLARRFWPGPLTMVLNRSAIIPDLVTAGNPTVAVRMPTTEVALGLLRRTGRPIAAPSANRSNRISPTRAEHVLADLDGLIDLVIDSGPTSLGLESTVLDLTRTPPRLLRPGPVAAQELKAALAGPPVVLSQAGGPAERPMSPGQMPVHYAPRTPAYRVESPEELGRLGDLEKAAVIMIGAWPDPSPMVAARYFRLESPEIAARRLYDVLHECDRTAPGSIVVVMPPDRPEWLAVRDRLLRATRPLAELG